MSTKPFDIIAIGHPCVDYAIHIDHMPVSNESAAILDCSWQGGGVTTTGVVAAARQGLKCALVGAQGDDLFGRFCYRDFLDHGIDLSHLAVRRDRTTDIGTILSDAQFGGRSILYRGGSYERLDERETDWDFFLKGDYLYIATGDSYHVRAAKYVKENGGKVLIDAGYGTMKDFGEILPFIDYFVGSEFLYNASFDSMDYESCMREISGKGPGLVVFTFGAQGARAYSREEGYMEIPGFRVPVVDTVGAGDVFHGAFFYGLINGYSAAETIRYASAVAAIKCTTIGGRAGIPTPEVTHRFLNTGEIDRRELEARRARYSWGLDAAFREGISGASLPGWNPQPALSAPAEILPGRQG